MDIYRHEGLHRTREEWDNYLLREGSKPASEAYNAHSHPALGIDLHLHRQGEEPHRHQPKWDWDTTPIPLA